MEFRIAATLFVSALSVSAQAPAPGHRLYGAMSDSETYLVDSDGATIHSWPSAFLPGLATYLDADGNLLRSIRTRVTPLAGAGGGLQRVAHDGTVLWDFRYDGPGVLSHHDIAILPNGNVLMIAWEDKTMAEAVAAGRHPALVSGVLRPDHLIEVRQTGPTSGEIVWEWHAWDHLIQDVDPDAANFGVVANHPELIDLNYPLVNPPNGDWLHFNGIDYDPVYDRIVVSTNNASEIWVIDHSTTTAEAAGHTGGRWGKGGDLLYRWGNVEAHRAGGPEDRVFAGQHSPRFVPPGYPGAGHITVFLNHLDSLAQSAVFELVQPLDHRGRFVIGPSGRYGPAGPVWSYTDPSFYSINISSAQRLPNGNTLICSGRQAWIFEVTPAGQQVASYRAPSSSLWIYHANYVDRSLWTDGDAVSTAAGGAVDLSLAPGSRHAGDAYLVLGSITGTAPGTVVGGVRLPLVVDAWTVHTLLYPNSPLLTQTLGVLDASGRGRATLFDVPGGVLPPVLIGQSFHHAFVVVDAASLELRFASNPVSLTITK